MSEPAPTSTTPGSAAHPSSPPLAAPLPADAARDAPLPGADAEVLFAHAGAFPHEAVVTGAQRLRTLPGLGENARHRLHAAFIELAQNIARYSAERAGPEFGARGSGAIRLLAPAEGPLFLVAENPVPADAAPRLSAALAELGSLDSAALKNLHRERRRSAPPPGSLGAGLGLIELHRHACAPVRHALEPAASPGRPPLLRIVLPLARD